MALASLSLALAPQASLSLSHHRFFTLSLRASFDLICSSALITIATPASTTTITIRERVIRYAATFLLHSSITLRIKFQTGGVETAVAVGVPSRAGGSFGAWLRPCHIVLFCDRDRVGVYLMKNGYCGGKDRSGGRTQTGPLAHCTRHGRSTLCSYEHTLSMIAQSPC